MGSRPICSNMVFEVGSRCVGFSSWKPASSHCWKIYHYSCRLLSGFRPTLQVSEMEAFVEKVARFVCPVKSGPGKFSSRDPLRVSQSPETHRLGCPSFCALSARGGWLVEAGARRGLDRLEVGRLCRPTRVSRLARLGSTKPNGEKAGTGMQKPTVPRAPGLPPEKVVGVGARGV